MIDLTQDAIQVFLDHPRGEGMIVSCYADTSVAGGFVSLWPQHLKNEASAIEQRLPHDHQARAFRQRIPRSFDTRSRNHCPASPGMALFSAADRGFFRAFPLGVPIKDRLVLDEAPYLVPLLEAIHRQRRYLLVLTDSHRGRMFEAAWGHTQLLRQIDKDIPQTSEERG